MRGSGDYDKKKKDTVVCLAGCAVVDCVSFWFWREIGSFFVVAGNFDYDRKKKIQSSIWRVLNIKFVLVQLELKLIQIR